MPGPDHSTALARVARALAHAAPEQGLHDALRELEPLGLTTAQAGDEACWLSVTHAEHALQLWAAGPNSQRDGAFRDALAALLQLWLARHAERSELQAVRERMELLSAASFEGLLFHVDGVVFDVNTRLSEMLGYPREELLGPETMTRCVAPEDLPSVLARLASGYEGAYVITGVRKDGSRFRAELQATQGRLGDRPVRVAAVRDVTEREHTQALLRESETRLRDLARTTFDVTVFSRDGVILDVMGSLDRVLGYTREEFVGRGVLDFVEAKAAGRVSQAMSEHKVGTYETTGVAKDGTLVPLEIVAVQSTLHGEPVRVSAVRDLREAKRLEEERRKMQMDLLRSQRVESLGVLAGGIAHDFNNLLMGILGYGELLERRIENAQDRELLHGILESARRAASLTAQLLAYAGRKELGPRAPIDLDDLLRELRVLLDALLSKKATLSVNVEQRCVVLGNRATLTQVVMNLLTNASDALGGEAGTITVDARRVAAPDARFADAFAKPPSASEWVLFEVSDTGCGMSEDTRQQIFEPFFTTKDKGHGLGLSACLGIVTSHGGAIVVESSEGHGSRFSMLLPAYGELPVSTAVARTPRRATEQRVLIVDDEPVVRSQLRLALLERGYQVTAAENGRAALDALAAAGANGPQLIVLDMTMPDLSGVEVLRQIREHGYTMPVVLSSGYHDAALDLDPGQFQGFLIKPYTLAQLYDTIEQALQTAPSNRP